MAKRTFGNCEHRAPHGMMFIPIHLTSDVEAARHCRCEVTRDMAIALRNVRLLEFWCRP